RPQHRGTHHTVNEDQENPQVSEPLAAPATPGLPTPRDDPSRMPSGTTRNGAPSQVEYQLGQALTWQRRGMHVLPASADNKRPLVGGFGKDATDEELAKFRDPDWIRDCWTGKYKRAHVALVMVGLVAIDLDSLKAGAAPLTGRWAGFEHGSDVLEQLMREAGGTWPDDTFTVLTPGKGKRAPGMHLLFQQPTDGPPIGCACGDGDRGPHLGPLIDVKAGPGGILIAAGSYSPSQGRPYRQISPSGVRPQPLPPWLLALLRRPAPERPRAASAPIRALPTGSRAERAATAALETVVTRISALREGDHRNGKLFGAARWLGELAETAPHVLTENAVEDALLGAAAVCGMRGGGQRAALATIRSGWKTGLQQGAGHGAGAA
ncbi:MAG: hypothetical protein JWO98_3882, partial [Frankiales bacterium]|nr:hypothetical protein [Frankiales bacterium]